MASIIKKFSKENFFDGNELAAIEAMPDGFLYSNILLKMYLKSLRDEGRLMVGAIPYDAEMIANIAHHKVKTVKKPLNCLKKQGFPGSPADGQPCGEYAAE